jgi:hypothetical protein
MICEPAEAGCPKCTGIRRIKVSKGWGVRLHLIVARGFDNLVPSGCGGCASLKLDSGTFFDIMRRYFLEQASAPDMRLST